MTLNEAAFPSPRRSLATEEKNSAIFGSQQTATLDRSLVSVKWRHWQHNWSAFSLSRLRFFLLTRLTFFFSTRLAFYFSTQISKLDFVDSCLQSRHLLSIFSFMNEYFANLESNFYWIRCILQFSIYIIIMFSTCFSRWFDFVRNRAPSWLGLVESDSVWIGNGQEPKWPIAFWIPARRPHASAFFWKRRFFSPFSKNTRPQI